jgi:hypothetical protein
LAKPARRRLSPLLPCPRRAIAPDAPDALDVLLRAIGDRLPVRALTPEGWRALSRLVKRDLVDAVGDVAAAVRPGLRVKGRTGRAIAWAHVPWVGVHDPRVPSKARTGVYAALLFAVDGRAATLSVQIGSDSRTAPELRAAVARVRQTLPVPEGFTAAPPPLVPADLRSAYDAGLSPYRYERASVLARTLPLATTPAATWRHALHVLVTAYTTWADAQASR